MNIPSLVQCVVCSRWHCQSQCPDCGSDSGSPAAPLKYHNEPCVVDGVRFDSKREAERWGELVMMQALGHITELKRQVPFRLVVNGHLVCVYIADATYYDSSGLYVVEDVKGVRTRLYRLKAKLMLACRGLVVREIR